MSIIFHNIIACLLAFLIIWKWLRDQLHLTQEQLAEKLGVDSRTVQRWESGRSTPQKRHQEAFLKVAIDTKDFVANWESVSDSSFYDFLTEMSIIDDIKRFNKELTRRGGVWDFRWHAHKDSK